MKQKPPEVDSSFAEIFTLDFIEGSPEQVLNEPGQVLLDRSTAGKYFGEESAMGEVIMVRDTMALTVTGVYEDFPSQSHFHFNMLISLISFEGLYNNDQWFSNNFETYLRLKAGYPGDTLEAKLPDFLNLYVFDGNL